MSRSVHELYVYRWEEYPETEAAALPRHQRRGQAVRKALASEAGFVVYDWGDTDDTKSHESVVVYFSQHVLPLAPMAIPAAVWLGQELAKAAVDEAAALTFKTVFARMWKSLRRRDVSFYTQSIPTSRELQGARQPQRWDDETRAVVEPSQQDSPSHRNAIIRVIVQSEMVEIEVNIPTGKGNYGTVATTTIELPQLDESDTAE
jgi:hypothetical protein